MATMPPIVFDVSFSVPGEMRWCMRAKGVIDDWLHSDAAGTRPIGELPAADLQMETDHCVMKLHWLELEATNAWAAIQRASQIVEEVLPELLKTRTMRVDATLQNPDPDLRRRPVGS